MAIAANAPKNNVVMLNTGSIYSVIETFLADKALSSEHTARAYEADIRQFFMVMHGKHIEHLTFPELLFKHSEIKRYRKHVVDEGKSNSTVNRKMSSVFSLYQFLEKDYPKEIQSAVFKVARLAEKTQSYGVLELTEAQEMVERVKAHKKGMEKALLIEFAMLTSFRVEAVLSVVWSNITFDNAKGYWVTRVYDKGEKLDEKPLPDDFYQRLYVLRENAARHNDDSVFHLDKKTPAAMMQALCREMNIAVERNIKFHSLKKVLMNWTIENGGSILDAALQGNHSDINTTYKHYLKKKKDMSNMPAMQIGKEVDLSSLEGKSAEELLEIIKSLGHGVKAEIVKRIN